MAPPRSIGTTVLGIATAAFLALSLTPAHASLGLPRVVAVEASARTPQVVDTNGVNNNVLVFAQVGDVMYVGGVIGNVQNAARTVTYARSNVFAFRVSTGDVLGFAPAVNGAVWAIVPQGDGSLVLGGSFTGVNGVARRGLARVSSGGVLDTGFTGAGMRSGGVTDAQLVRGLLIVSGSFPARLIALNPGTGADTGYIRLPVTGTVASNAGATRVYRFAVNPAGTRLVGIGNFTSVGGLARRQAFMADLGASQATMSSWYDPNLAKQCSASILPAYLRDVDWSPDGATFGLASTGFVPKAGDLGLSICDAAALYDPGSNRPRWINYTGGDTLHSIAVTGPVVYVGGHQRWLDNPLGRDSAGRGAQPRPGIGAIDATTGKAISWNPGKTRGVGAKVLYVTSSPAGLWVGSDGRMFHGKVRDSLAFCAMPSA
jgi:hypothetical protein